jgi:hypothetical protein
MSEDNQRLEIHERISIQPWRSGQGTHNAGVEGSIPSLSTNDLRVLSITQRKVGVEDSWDVPIRFAAANNRPISAALTDPGRSESPTECVPEIMNPNIS